MSSRIQFTAILVILTLTGTFAASLGVILTETFLSFSKPSSPSQVQISQVECSKSIICPGEDLTYEAKWWIFKLGRVRLKTLGSNIRDGQTRHSAVVFIDSYSGLPFVDVHAINYTEMDSVFSSCGFHSVEKQKDEWTVTKYHYNRSANILIVEETLQKDAESAPSAPSKFDTLRIEHGWYQDGLSLLYFTRLNVQTSRTVRVPTIIYGKAGSTLFHFTNKKTTVKIGASEDPVRVVEFEGKAGFTGLFGLTGQFKGWFSDDAAKVPIKAKMKVILGSITIELKRWEREEWSLPIEKR